MAFRANICEQICFALVIVTYLSQLGQGALSLRLDLLQKETMERDHGGHGKRLEGVSPGERCHCQTSKQNLLANQETRCQGKEKGAKDVSLITPSCQYHNKIVNYYY
jgi:hypothetical protein